MIHIVDRIEEIIKKMKWKTIDEVGRVLPNDSTNCHTSRMHICCGSSKSNLQFGSNLHALILMVNKSKITTATRQDKTRKQD